MATSISRLASKDQLAANDQLAVFSEADADTRKTSISTVLAFINANTQPFPDVEAVATLADDDTFLIYDHDLARVSKVSGTGLRAYLRANLRALGAIPQWVVQRSTPSSNAWTVTLTDGADNTSNLHLILTPTTNFAVGTIVLPPAATCVDQQQVMVNCTQSITTLTLVSVGATAITGEPGALSADGFFTLKFDQPSLSWYRVA